MPSHLTLIILLSLILSLSTLTKAANAQTSTAACNAEERPNVDCDCVDKRMQVYLANTDSMLVKSFLVERYKHAVGLNSNIEKATVDLMSDMPTMISAQMSYDRLGGLPNNVQEFERGCLISGQEIVVLPELAAGSAASLYALARNKNLGEGSERNSNCIVNRMLKAMTDDEIRAYHLSFSHYEGDHLNDNEASRAKKMGISKAEYQTLERSGRKKYNQNYELDTNYCSALLYAEGYSPERIALERKQEAARFSILETN